MTGVKDTGAVLEIVRATRERGVDAVLCMVGDGPDRERLEQLAHDLGHRALDLLRRLPGGRRRLLPPLRRVPPPVRQRRNAGERDRGARVRHAGRRDTASAACPMSCATASTGSSSSPETPTPRRIGSRELAPTRSSERGSASRDARTCASATRSIDSSTTSTASTGRCSRRRASS